MESIEGTENYELTSDEYNDILCGYDGWEIIIDGEITDKSEWYDLTRTVVKNTVNGKFYEILGYNCDGEYSPGDMDLEYDFTLYRVYPREVTRIIYERNSY